MDYIKTEIPEIVFDFYNYLISTQKYSKCTIRYYIDGIVYFIKFIKEYKDINTPIEDFTIFNILTVDEKDIIAFLIFLNVYRKNIAETRNVRLAAIKSFYSYLFNCSKYSYYCKNKNNPTSKIDYSKKAFKLPKCLSLEEASNICNCFNPKNSRYYIRNNTIIYLFLNTGLRKSELINLNINNINFKEQYINVMGKGKKERIVYITKNTKNMILNYLSTRKNINYDSDKPLFVSSRKTRLSRESINIIIKNAYKITNIENKGYTVHSLRHTAATLMYKGTNGDILAIKEILGHSSIESTQIYTHVINEEIKKAINSNPLANYKV